MFSKALLFSIALALAVPAPAQEAPARSPYTIDEFVEGRRPVITPRELTGDEKAQARELMKAIHAALKQEKPPARELLEQLAPLAESSDRKMMKTMVLGYAGAGELLPWPADADQFSAWWPNSFLSGLWAMKAWQAGDRSKEVSKAVDSCWNKGTKLEGRCGYTITVEAEGDPFFVFRNHWQHGKSAPRDVVFTEHTLTPPFEKQKARFDAFVARMKNGESYTAWDYIWAEVWAKRNGPQYLAELEKAQIAGSAAYVQRQAAAAQNAKDERAARVAEWDKLQAKRTQAKAANSTLSESDEARWVQLSHVLGGKYLVPFGSENVILRWTTIDSLCRDDSGPVCQRQKQLYEYRAEEARAERAARDAALRNFKLGGSSVKVRTYDHNGNYLGTETMPAWQADVIGAQ